MIEFKKIIHKDGEPWTTQWMTIGDYSDWQMLELAEQRLTSDEIILYRFNDSVTTGITTELKDLYNKLSMWEKLKE